MKLDLEIEGPESIAISPNGNEIYTGIVGGEIVRIKESGKVTVVAKFGQACGMIPWTKKAGRNEIQFLLHVACFINLQKENGKYSNVAELPA